MLETTTRSRAHFRSADGNVAAVLARHFGDLSPVEIVTSSRSFPLYLRADLQLVLERLWGDDAANLLGLYAGRYAYSTTTYASLLAERHEPVRVAPLQYEDVDVGDAVPIRCLRNALWLGARGDLRFAVLLSAELEHSEAKGWHLEICVQAGEDGASLTREYFRAIEDAVSSSASYRGKVLSLERDPQYRGTAVGNLMVHRLAAVAREDVILPQSTLTLLERNVFEFVRQRGRLRALGMSVKKGLLFYGPPGTGKTHTIRYLAGALPNHTTLIITAAQIAILGHYMAIARLLSPAMIVIEDVDLIAREREHHDTPGRESLLNRLLNEMDGLRENTDVMFVLTTNHPESLEAALTGRPGRIDQAVEFPLPDDDGRRRLVELYRRKIQVSREVADEIVRRTDGVSASFIKELVRRTAQFALERDSQATDAVLSDVESALAELLFEGGSLNAKLLGARVAAT